MDHSLAFRLRQGAQSARVPFAYLLLVPLCAQAQTWKTTASGAWDTGSNWSTGTAPNSSSATAVFGANTASGGTSIAVNTAVTVGTLQFNSGAPAYTITLNSNSSLTLAGSGVVNNSSNPLSLTVNANARLNFTGSSTAANSVLFASSKGVIDFSGSSGTITAGSLGGTSSSIVYLGSKTLTVGSLGTSTLFQGVVQDGGNAGGTGGSLTKVGSGTLTFDHDNTYTGLTTISAGALQVGNGGSAGSIVSNVLDNASLIFNRGNAYTYAGVISGSGTVTKLGSGAVTLSGVNTYTGGTLLNAGALVVSADNNLGGSASNLTFNGGTLRFGAGFTSARSILLSGAGSVDTNSFTSTLSGVISGAGAFTKAGTGTLILTGSETYSGGTTISGGTLQIGSGGTTGVIAGNVTDNATLAFNRSDSQTFAGVISGSGALSKLGSNVLTLTGANTYSGATTISAGTLQIGNGSTTGSISGAVSDSGALIFNRSDSFTYGGVISGTGTVTKSGAGTLTLTGASTVSGNTTISAGTLQIGNGGTSGSFAGPIVNNGALAFNRSDSSTYGGIVSGTGSLTNLGGALTLTGANTFTGGTTISAGTLQVGNGGTSGSLVGPITNNGALAFNRSNDSSFAGAISGTGSLTKLGLGTTTLSGNNTYAGATNVNAGTLILTGSNAGTGTITIGTSGTLQVGNGGTTGSIVGDVVDNGVLEFNRSDDFTIASNISGTGSLIKDGAGTLTLTGTINYTGTTTILGGALLVGTGGTTGTLNGDLVLNGTLTFNRSDDYLYADVISGSGSLTKLGAGTLTFTGANGYTGGTTISAGALQLGNGGTTGSLIGNIVDNSSLIFNRSDSYSFGGVISGTGTVTNIGTGALTLTADNTYSGGTTISAGTVILTGANTGGGTTTIASGASLQVGNGGTTGSIAGDIVDNGVLAFNRSDDFSFGGAISGTGSLVKSGAGTLTLTGAISYSGTTTINGGQLLMGNGGSVSGDLVINTALTFNRTDTYTYGGVISGSGSVNKLGTGTVIFTGANTYTGGTTISAGTLQLGNGGASGSIAGAVNIGSAGTLAFNRSDFFFFDGDLSGSGTLLVQMTGAAGAVKLTGSSTFTGTTTVSSGTLMGTTQNLRGSILDNGTVYFNQEVDGTYSGSISGTGRLIKQGHMVTLTGANTYSGSTILSAGDLSVSGAGASINGTSGITVATASFADSTLWINGGSITTPGALTLGDQGTARLLLRNSGSLNTGSAVLGSSAGSNGWAFISGGSSTVWTNTGVLTVGSAGTGTLIVEDNATLHSGSIVLAGLAGSTGTLNIGLGQDAATIDTQTVSGGAGTAVVNFNHNNAAYVFAPQLAGNLSVTLTGSGTTALTGNNTYTGGTTVSNGVLSISSDTNLGDSSGALTLAGGALRMNGANVARAVTLADAGGTIDTSNSVSTVSGVISGAASLSVAGNGSLVLTGANTYTGGTYVNNGALIGNSTSLQGPISNNAVVQFNQAVTGTYAGDMAGAGSLVKQGGQLTLTGTSTYTGATTIMGALQVSGGGVVNGTSGITLAATGSSNASLELNSSLATVRTTGSITVGQAGTGSLNINSGGLLTSADGTLGATAGANGNATVTGANSLWSASGRITVGGSGTGTLTVSNGGVVAANSIRLGDAAGSSGTLNIGAGGAAGIVNTAVITGGVGSNSAINFNHTNSSYLFATQLGGGLSVTLTGSGTTILTAANTYTGQTTIGSGTTLQIGNGGTTGSIVGDIVDNGILAFNRSDDFTFGGSISGTGSLVKMGAGTLTLTGTVTYSGTTTVLGGALVIGTGGTSGNWNGDLNINSTLTFNRADDLVYGYVVSGTGSVLKMGTGTLILTGINTYTGGTTISVGTLQIGNGGTTGRIVGDVTDNANLAFNRSDNVSFDGAITGTGTLTKLGTGALVLTGANSFTGGTVINSGTLQIGAGGTTGALAGNVTDNGALVFNRSDNTSFVGAITGTGTLSKLGAGTLNLTGNNTYTGATSLSGTLRVSGGGRIEGTSGITIGQGSTNSATLYVTGGGSRVTTAGSILVGGSGSGTLTIDNGATVTAGGIVLGSSGGPGGTLNIGTGGASGSLNAAAVVEGVGAGSVVNLNHTDTSYTLASSLRNNLTLNQNGSGTTILAGANTYTGGTYLNAGTLRVTSDANLGASGSTLTFNGGTLQLGATITNLGRPVVLNAAGGTIDTGTFTIAATGTITGTGALTKLGSGTLTLSGTASYSGGTTVGAGTLRGTTNSLKGNIVNNGTVAFQQATDGSYTGVMSGTGGLSKLGAGNLTLTSANTYTGATSITAGSLTVNGSISSPVTVGVSGTFGGVGTVSGDVNVLGTFAPGSAASPYGTMTLNGNVTFQTGSFFQVQTDPTGHNSAVNVLGAAHTVTINGGTVNVLTGGSEYAANTQYTLITAAGVSGTFDGPVSDFAFLTPTLSYDSTRVYLTLHRNDVPFTALAVGRSQIAAARYLDSLSAASVSNTLVQDVLNLTAPQATKAFNDLSGNSLTELSRVSMANTARVFEMLASRLGTADTSAGTGLAFSTLPTGDPRAASSEANVLPGTGFWARQLIADGDEAKAGGGAEGYKSRGVHTAMGFDAVVNSGTLVGMSAVYTRDEVQLGSGRTQASYVRTPQLMAYASHTADTLQIRGVAGCGDHSYESQRAVTVGMASSVLSARHDATECTAYAQAEFGRAGGDRQLRPLLGLLYSRLDEGRYVERGGVASLAVAAHVTESFTSNAGLRFNEKFAHGKGVFEARAVWRHEFADANPTLRASLASDTSGAGFAVQGVPRGRDSGVVGAGISMRLRRSFLFHTDYNLELDSDRQVRQAVVAGLSYVY